MQGKGIKERTIHQVEAENKAYTTNLVSPPTPYSIAWERLLDKMSPNFMIESKANDKNSVGGG